MMSVTEMLSLIREYLTSARAARDLLRSKFGIDDLLRARRLGILPKNGWLDRERRIHYSIHGVGCTIESGDGVINFDFGPGGLVDGFDLWRLQQFLESRREKYPSLRTVEQQELAFAELVQEGLVAKSDEFPSPHLYRLREDDVGAD